MVSELDLIINYDSIKISHKMVVTGEIYFQMGHVFFPEEGWNDFIVNILAWWINALKEYYINKSAFELLFMDGPLLVKCKPVSANLLEVKFVRDVGSGEQVFGVTNITCQELENLILKASRKILRKAEMEQWPSQAIMGLRNNIKFLKNK